LVFSTPGKEALIR